MHRVVFLDRATLAPQIRLAKLSVPHEWIEHNETAPDEIVARAKGASVIVLNKVRLSAEAIAALPGLKLVAVAATGTDCVDKDAAKKAGVAVANIRGYAVNTLPEHTFALILALRRAIIPYRRDVIAGAWQKSGQFCFFDYPMHDLSGKRFGVVGAGILGRRVGEIGAAFGMDVVYYDPFPPAQMKGVVTLDELIATSDIITLHCPLTPETQGLIGIKQFRAMKKKPIIINTARGGLVIEDDLVTALDQGLISGAGFDVTMPEPPPSDSPLMKIADRDNVIVTPHVAWASDEAQQALADQLIENIELFLAGKPRHLV